MIHNPTQRTKTTKAENLTIVITDSRISLNKGTEAICLEIDEDRIHIYATDRSGARTIATLEFREHEVISLGKNT